MTLICTEQPVSVAAVGARALRDRGLGEGGKKRGQRHTPGASDGAFLFLLALAG